jgi:hypothetical protein
LSLIFYYEFYKKYKGKLTIEELEKTGIIYLIYYKNPILFTIILILCCKDKVEKDNSFDNKSNKILFYKKYILSLNLMHSDYNDIIYELYQDIEKNMSYFPYLNITETDFEIMDGKDENKLFIKFFNKIKNHYFADDFNSVYLTSSKKQSLSFDDLYFTNIEASTNNNIIPSLKYNYNTDNVLFSKSFSDITNNSINDYNKKISEIFNLNDFLEKINIKNINISIINIYLKYIYLCYFFKLDFNRKIFDKFNTYINFNNDSKFYWLYLIITEQNNKPFNNEIQELNDIIIPNTEKKNLENIEYITINNIKNNYYESKTISFYLYELQVYNNINIPLKTNEVLIPVKSESTSIELFNNHILNSTYILPCIKNYILLNFNLKLKNESTIICEEKINKLDKTQLLYNIKDDPKYNIIKGNLYIKINDNKKLLCLKPLDSTTSDEIQSLFSNKVNHNFYNLLLFNDSSILVYYCMKYNVIYYQLNNFDLLFYINNKGIFYDFDNYTYKISFNNNELFENYNIFKLTKYNLKEGKPIDNDIKYLCFYSYNKYYEYNFDNYGKNIHYFNDTHKFLEYKEKEISYKILDVYNDEIILKNMEELNIILVNCFLFNSSMLLLKCIPYIKILLFQNKIDFKETYKKITKYFTNVFSLPLIYIIFGNVLNLSHYSISNYENLYKKFNLKIENKLSEENYLKTNLTQTFLDEILLNKDNFTITRNNIDSYNTIDIKSYVIDFNFKKIEVKITMIDKTDRIRPLSKKYIIDLNEKEKDNDIKQKFIDMVKKNVNNFDEEKFNYAIKEYCDKYFIYLTNIEKKPKPIPIQELIMGIGKTSTIIPYTCLLYINYLIENKIFNQNIYIVLPENLIVQIFEIIIKNIFSIYKLFIPILFNKKYEYDIEKNESDEIKIIKNYYDVPKLIVISDLDFKELFLNKDENNVLYPLNQRAQGIVAIYDEVDNMADNTKNELNIIDEKTHETVIIEQIIKLSEIFYNTIDINKKNNIWTYFDGKKIYNNGIHNYLIDNIDIINTIKDYFNFFIDPKIKQDKIIDNYNKDITNYLINTIYIYILTNQYNKNYGIPKTYPKNLNLSSIYKFKAIPYNGIDNPLYGSELSDPNLTLILTYFSYKYMNYKYRINDYEKLLSIYTEIIEKNKNDIFSKIENLFDCYIMDLNFLKLYKNYVFKHIKKSTQIDDNDFYLLIKNILLLNIKYYTKCLNISFTDLLLVDNISKFIGLTGTSYIFPPRQIINNKEFEQKIKIISKVEDQIKNIISDKKRLKKFLVHDGTIDEHIFSIITNYTVLIDIAGIFVNYNIDQFIKKYREIPGRKKNIIYFDNGIKLYNLDDNYIDILGNNICDNCFFYFSNKNITGVDAKSYMPKNAHGLVTISNNTLFRDFSQGIYRMRDIKDSQTFDIIMLKKSFDIKFKGKDNIRQKIITMLLVNQEINNNSKKKLLYKQNIFGLTKYNSDNKEYNKNINSFDIILYDNILKTGNKKDIDIENIDNKIEKIKGNQELHTLCNKIKKDYEKMETNDVDVKIAQSVQQQEQKQEEVTLEVNTSIKLEVSENIKKQASRYKINKVSITNINSNFVLTTNKGTFNNNYVIILYNKSLYDKDNKSLIYALYIHDKNILFLVDKIYLYKIIHFIEMRDLINIFLFDYNSNIVYGKTNMKEDDKKSINIMIKILINNFKAELEYDKEIFFTMEENELIELNKDLNKDLKIIENVFFPYNISDNNKWRKKYLKYKQKYLNLLNS